MHFAVLSSHTLPSCEIGAHSEIPYKMYNAAPAIKVHQSLALSQKAPVFLPNGHAGTRTQGEGRLLQIQLLKMMLMALFPFTKAINYIVLKTHQTFGACADGVWNPRVGTLRVNVQLDVHAWVPLFPVNCDFSSHCCTREAQISNQVLNL